MNKLKWWLRLTGGFYLFLGVMNVVFDMALWELPWWSPDMGGGQEG
jgi:hypothetical protein